MYRSPKGEIDIFEDILTNALAFADSLILNKNILVLGDFTVPFHINNSLSKIIILMNSFYLERTIFNFTRITDGFSTCIENIFINISSFDMETTDFG